MHDIEPYYRWIDKYCASTDSNSPFYGREYSEFFFSNQVYNYLIHPQWDEFGSQTLYAKILYADYEEGYAVLEFIGEWNDCIHNDIMILMENVIQPMQSAGVDRFVFVCENVLNFHGSDDCYYEEWHEDLVERGGWVFLVNLHQHVLEEMQNFNIHHYAHLHSQDYFLEWRSYEPGDLVQKIESIFKPSNLLHG